MTVVRAPSQPTSWQLTENATAQLRLEADANLAPLDPRSLGLVRWAGEPVTYSQARDELPRELRILVESAYATNAFVFDAWGIIWCSATLTFGDGEARLYAQVPEIFDWMIVDQGALHGGFTLRVTRHRLPEAERADYDRHVGAISWHPLPR